MRKSSILGRVLFVGEVVSMAKVCADTISVGYQIEYAAEPKKNRKRAQWKDEQNKRLRKR